MFIETAVALVGIGILVGFAIAYLVAVLPMERQQRRVAARYAREARLRRYQQAARSHRGTPYIAGGIREW